MIDSGVPKDRVIQYWNYRVAQQGKGTVGFNNIPIADQDKNYDIRSGFIMSHVDADLFTLDYGCGVGRYSQFFDKDKYLGVDITKQLLDIAIDENAGYDYILLSSPSLTGVSLSIDQFFTATVLQHNTNETVRTIFDGLSKCNLRSIVLYESTMDMPNKAGSHMNFRSVDDYYNLVSEYFNKIGRAHV